IETAEPAPDRVYGTAYRIPAAHVEEVKAYLDIREINGYSIQHTVFYPSQPSASAAPSSPTSAAGLPFDVLGKPIANCLVYIGLPTNPQFLGRQDPDAVAEVIARSKGPSGRNTEYLFMLEKALEGLNSGTQGRDDHVRGLAGRVRRLLGEGLEEAEGEVRTEMQRVRSGEGGTAGEETEKAVVACVTGD
ncbi:MAG: hypothetical protein Q9217_007085, partial [Psora testacea]